MWKAVPLRKARAAYLPAIVLPLLLLCNYFGPDVISPESRASLQSIRITYQEAADRLLVSIKEAAVPLSPFSSHVDDKNEIGLCKGRPCSKARAKPLRHITSQQPLMEDQACLEAWLLRGEVCPTLDLSASSKIDAVWTWVNGSEPRHGALRRKYMAEMSVATIPDITPADDSAKLAEEDPLLEEEKAIPGGTASSELGDEVTLNYGTAESRFRDNNELLFAVRSVVKHLGSSLGNMHIITPDFPDEEEYRPGEGEPSTTFTVEGGRFRLGQLPRWLDTTHSQVRTGEAARQRDQDHAVGQLYVHHNWDTFSPLLAPDRHISGARANKITPASSAEDWTEDQMLKWKTSVVPNFNSIAIESTMGSDTGMSDAYYYANDDMYLGRDISSADMISPLFGPSLLIRKSKMVAPWRDAPFTLGYNAELYYSNALLSDRFGTKNRPYVSHTQKVVSQPLMDEMKLLFHEQVSDLRRFRATGPDINFAFMLYHTIIERHREALLWSFFVARSDQDGDGMYSAQETRDMVHDLGIDKNLVPGKGESKVYHPAREAWKEGEMSRALVKARHPPILNTTIRFSSMESGYASPKLFNVGPVSWPNFAATKAKDSQRKHACNLAAVCVQKVLKGDSASESLFTFFTFEQPECGDCAITQLLGKSGPKGYGAFLPNAGLDMPETLSADVEEYWESNRQERVAHLPLTDHWNKADFSLAGVAASSGLGGTSRQYFAMQLIQRYQYSVSYSPQILGLLKDEVSTEGFFEEFASSQMTWICINDEMDEGVSPESAAHIYEQIDGLLKTLFDDALPFEMKPQNDDDGEDDRGVGRK